MSAQPPTRCTRAYAYADAPPAAGQLPVEVNPAILTANIGDEAYLPAIAVTYRDIPNCITTPYTSGSDGPGGWAHQRRFLHINAGVLLFRIFDQVAWSSMVDQATHAAAIDGLGFAYLRSVPSGTGHANSS